MSVTKVTYEMLPESAQKAYRQTDKIRKVSMFIAIGLSVISMIYGLVTSQKINIAENFVFSLISGCCIHGLIHAEMMLKELGKKVLKSLFTIVFLPVNLIFFGIGIAVAMVFIGAPCMIIDLILYLKKKPLVYPFETKSFLKLKAVQEELEAKKLQEMMKSQEN